MRFAAALNVAVTVDVPAAAAFDPGVWNPESEPTPLHPLLWFSFEPTVNCGVFAAGVRQSQATLPP